MQLSWILPETSKTDNVIFGIKMIKTTRSWYVKLFQSAEERKYNKFQKITINLLDKHFCQDFCQNI